jgi:hypothetical protein
MNETYRTWNVDYDPMPIPLRGFEWTATSPDFDADCDEDGFFVCAGQQVSAATLKDLMVEIDCAIMELEDADV